MPCKPEVILNKALLIQQHISPERAETIRRSHVIKRLIFEEMEQTDDPTLLHQLAETLEQLETYQQLLWGFEPNRNHHYWFTYPKCRCPKMDNAERLGVDERIISVDCPVHGKAASGYPIN